MKKIRNVYFETYAIPLNVGESILKLNPLISKNGFEFIKLRLDDFEKNFSRLLNLPIDFTPEIMYEINGQLISKEFYNAVIDKNYFTNTSSFHQNGFIYLLKGKKRDFFKVRGNRIDPTRLNYQKTSEFAKDLFRKLRLFKSEYIDFQCIFNKSINDNQIPSAYHRNIHNVSTNELYEIKDEELKQLEIFIKKSTINETCAIALESYELSYTVTNLKMQFMLLIMGLESIFNRGKDQIRHTFSRHLAVLLSKNKSEFLENYPRFQKLYDIRSEIAHGRLSKKLNINQQLLELREITRLTIVAVNKLKLSQDKLFELLNHKGFDK